MKEDFKKVGAFTLAETLVTLTILGVVAAITVPNLVRKQVERTNRTKVKKAMAAYEKALNKMVIENDLRSDQALIDWSNQSSDCGNTAKYFKQVEGSGCQFKTADGVWWNISNIERPLISLKKIDENSVNQTLAKVTEYANNNKNMTAYFMVGRFDNNGVLRVNDNAYEADHAYENSDKQVAKLYNYINNVEVPPYVWSSEFSTAMANTCTTEPYKNCVLKNGNAIKVYDSKGNLVLESSYCNKTSAYFCQGVSAYDENGTKIMGTPYTYYYIAIGFDGNITSMDNGSWTINKNGEKISCNADKCYSQSGAINYTLNQGNKIYNDDFTEEVFTCPDRFCSSYNATLVYGNGGTMYNENWSDKVFTCEGSGSCYNTTHISNGGTMDPGGKLYNEDWSGEPIFTCGTGKCIFPNSSWKTIYKGYVVYNDNYEKVCECKNNSCAKNSSGGYNGCS